MRNIKYLASECDFTIRDFSEVDENNYKKVLSYLKSDEVNMLLNENDSAVKEKRFIWQMDKFGFEIKNEGVRFSTDQFCSDYNLDLHQILIDATKNPNILEAMGVGKLFGGGIGMAYMASGYINLMNAVEKRVKILCMAKKLNFFRNWDSVPEEERFAILAMKALYIEGLFSEDDFYKAVYSLSMANKIAPLSDNTFDPLKVKNCAL